MTEQLDLFRKIFKCPKGMTWLIKEQHETFVFAKCLEGDYMGHDWYGQMLCFQIKDIELEEIKP